jgi:hypothetical protein
MFYSLRPANVLFVRLINCENGNYYLELVLDRVPFNGSGFRFWLEPDPNPMVATRNFRENFGKF